MSSIQPREFLMIPGPTPVPDAVLEAVARHPIGHRSAEFSKVLLDVTESLKWLGETANDVFILTASGTGAMEAAIANTINAGDSVLSLISGVFGERLAKIAEVYGAKVERLNVEAGQAILPSQLRSKLSGSTSFKAVTITHNETSTGVMNDVEQLVKITREHGALSIVDAVTSFGAARLPIDAWNIDVVVAGSQKALMLPPGLSVIFFGKRAWKAQASSKSPRFYFDLARCKKSLEANTTPFTPNVSLVAGLQAALKLMRAEGIEAIGERHHRLQAALRAGLRAMNLELFVADEHASPTLTSILPPGSITVDAIRCGLKEKFRITVADGQEALKGKIFRIGHMGYVFERDILMTLASLESVLSGLGHDCGKEKATGAAGAVLSGHR